MTRSQRFTRTAGAFYLFIGIVGCVGALGGTTSQTPGDLFGLLEVTVISNIVHLGVGAALWAATETDALARTISTLVGIALLLIAILGIAGIETVNDLMGKSIPGSALHLATSAAAIFFGQTRPTPSDGTV